MNDVAPPRRLPAVVPPTGGGSIFASPADYEFAQRVGRMFSEATLVPEHLRGNLPNCVVAFGIAKRMNEDPLMVMQNIYFVHGRAGWHTQYMIARANRCGTFRGPLRWESTGQGDNLAVTCFAYLAHVEQGDDPRVEITVSMAMAKADGWTRNEKYRSIPEQMLRWRSAAWLIRLYAPEVMLGYPTQDELEDGDKAWVDVTPDRPRPELRDFPAQVVEHEIEPPLPPVTAVTGLNLPHDDDDGRKKEPAMAPSGGGTAEPAGNGAAATSTTPAPAAGPSDTGEPAKPQRKARVLKAKPPEPRLPPGLEPFEEEDAGIPPADEVDVGPQQLETSRSAAPPAAAYDVFVPASTSLQAWFKPAKDRLEAMRHAGRPPEDFKRFREENSTMMKQMQDGFGFWANSLNDLIARGERPQ